MEERRKHKRYPLDNVCIINHSTTVGTIIDLSLGGLSCMCLDQGTCQEGLSEKIDIYCKSNDIRVEGLDMEVLDTGKLKGKFVEDIGLRKCRAKFCELDEGKVEQLANIIGQTSNPYDKKV